MTSIPTEIRAEIDKLERKYAENPDGRYFVPLANAYRRAGIVSRAISVLDQGIERHPEYLSARIVLGRCLTDQGQVDAARGEFARVLDLDPHNVVALRTLGELAVAAGNVGEARSRYDQLLAVDPMNEDARTALAALDSVVAPESVNAIADAASPEVPSSLVVDHEIDAVGTATASGVGFPVAEELPESPDSDPSAEEAIAAAAAGGNDGSTEYEGEEILITETIAELYTRQGFYARAIHVYRELIRRHGEDPRLQERLENVERLAISGAEAPGVPGSGEDAPIPSDPAAGAAAIDDRSEHRPTSPTGSDRAGIQDYLLGLLGLSGDRSNPASEPGPPAPSATASVDGETRGRNDHGIPTVSGTDIPLVEPVESRVDLPPLAFPEGGDRGSATVSEYTVEPAASGAPPAEYEAPTWGPAADARPAGDDELFPWEMPSADPAPTPAAAEPADPVSPTPAESATGGIDVPDTPEAGMITDAETSFAFVDDDLGLDEVFPDVAALLDESEPVASGVAEASEPIEPAGAAGAAGALDDDEDEDLESFQAWLRSLKR